MKRLLILLMATLFLVACGNKEDKPQTEEQPEESQEEYEVLSEQVHGIELYDNDDLTIKINKSRHEREGIQDWMKLEFNIVNKTNRSFDFYFDNMQLNKETYSITNISSTDTEIKPNEELDVIVIVESHEEITFDEYIGGKLIYSDYDDNRNVIEFGEYIND